MIYVLTYLFNFFNLPQETTWGYFVKNKN